MRVECHHDESVFETIGAEWNDLVSRSLTNTPFQRAEFQRAWWRHLGHGELRVLTMRDEAGGLAAIAPLFADSGAAGGGRVCWVGGEEIADYLDVIAPPQAMEAAVRATWDWLNSPAAPPWSLLDLPNIPEWTPTPRLLQSLAAEQGLRAEVAQIDVCPIIRLPATFEDYLQQIDSKQRREIKRKLRKAQASEDPVTWYLVGPDRDIGAETEAFMALMEAASPEKAAFLTAAMRAAFRELFAAMWGAGLLQLAFLEVGGHRAAGYAQFDYADRIWVYNSGIDPSVAGSLSTGWVLLAHLIERAIADGREVYDFMQGGESYKYRFGGEDTAVLKLTVAR